MPDVNNKINVGLEKFIKETLSEKLPKELLDLIPNEYINELVKNILVNKPKDIDDENFEKMIEDIEVNIPDEVKQKIQTQHIRCPNALPVIAEETDCPIPECKTFCGETIVEEDICMLPLLLDNCALIIPFIVDPKIELQCIGTAVVCGLIRKFILYVGVTQCKVKITCFIYDIPFQCVVKDNAINSEDNLYIRYAQVLCAGWRPITKGTRCIWCWGRLIPVDVYGKIIDKELVRVNLCKC